jgi:hypothetical protein
MFLRHSVSFVVWLVWMGSLLHGQSVGPSFKLRFQLDEGKRSIRLVDLAFPSNSSGVATGVYLEEKKNPKPVVVTSSDGGKTWAMVEVDDIGRMFFLNQRLGWMIGGKGIYRTTSAGQTWERISRQKGILDLHFLDENRGFAVGVEKQFIETVNGGRSWKAVKIKVSGEKRQTAFRSIRFIDQTRGVALGGFRPMVMPYPGYLPEMQPETPGMLHSLQTGDGGKTWSTDSISVFGYPHQVVPLSATEGLLVFRFTQNFNWSTVVYRLGWGSQGFQSFLKEKEWIVTEIIRLPDGRIAIAEVKRAGTLTQPEFPTQVRVLLETSDPRPSIPAETAPSAALAEASQEPFAPGWKDRWKDLRPNFKFQATNAQLAAKPDGSLWLLTNEGAILELVP